MCFGEHGKRETLVDKIVEAELLTEVPERNKLPGIMPSHARNIPVNSLCESISNSTCNPYFNYNMASHLVSVHLFAKSL